MAYGGSYFRYPQTCHGRSAFDEFDVDSKTRRIIKGIVKSTWDPDVVGIGQDGQNLDHDGIVVTDIKRICNPKLKSRYKKYKKYLYRKRCETGEEYDDIGNIPQKLFNFSCKNLSPDINEFYLFHGTDEDSAYTIAEEGFDPRVTNPCAMYGQGVYFAEQFTKADQYTDQKCDRDPTGTELTVLLCKVLLGDFLECTKKYAKKWKTLPFNGDYRYDSVLGSGRKMLFREFVVYDGEQCYPEYIITYKRVGWERYPPTDDEWM
uniref:Poly [ADP-ribose] polymerase n=2 Tax=Arion vulgaris TaxID=1028688 RepID=A0A0B7BK96_9EUPU